MRRRTRRKIRKYKMLLSLAVAAVIIASQILSGDFKPDEPVIIETGKAQSDSAQNSVIRCTNPHIVDGDTLNCNGTRIRLYSIDTPEMQGHCRQGRKCVSGDPVAAKNHLISLTRGNVTCTQKEIDHYGRTVATCASEISKNLSCDMVKAGHAILRYGNLTCN